MVIIIKEILTFAYWSGIVLISPALFRNNSEWCRKFVHIMIANWWFIGAAIFNQFIHACIVPAIFVFINIYSTYGNGRGFVSEFKREKNDYSLGLISYPLGFIFALYFLYYKCGIVAGIGTMALGYGDGLAALVGRKFNYKPYYIFGCKKTLSGNIGMFVSTYISSFLYCMIYHIPESLVISALAAIVGSIVETIAVKGTDNLLIPVTVILSIIIFL